MEFSLFLFQTDYLSLFITSWSFMMPKQKGNVSGTKNVYLCCFSGKKKETHEQDKKFVFMSFLSENRTPALTNTTPLPIGIPTTNKCF